MQAFTVLIGQLFFIAILQTVLESFLDLHEKERHKTILGVACVLGSLYLLMQFVYNHLLREMATFITLPF